MKKILLILAAVLGLASTSNAAVMSTNVTAGGTYLLSAARANIYAIQISGNNNVLVEFFDNGSISAPYYGTNYTNASFVSRTSYATNYVTSYVGQNGYTNWYTNTGTWTQNVTNAAGTNGLSPTIALVQAANTVGTYPVDALHVRGIAFRTSTNASIVVYYNSGQ